jgi:hypothetical protein
MPCRCSPREIKLNLMRRANFLRGPAAAAVITALALVPPASAHARPAGNEVPDMTGQYRFLSPDDTLAILEEEGQLKGYVDVFQGDEESDDILSYPITTGTRAGNHVEFKTGKIHDRYYRFVGTVERGRGRKEDDADYLRLVGNLDIVTENPASGQESVERRPVVFLWKSKSERQPGP